MPLNTDFEQHEIPRSPQELKAFTALYGPLSYKEVF